MKRRAFLAGLLGACAASALGRGDGYARAADAVRPLRTAPAGFHLDFVNARYAENGVWRPISEVLRLSGNAYFDGPRGLYIGEGGSAVIDRRVSDDVLRGLSR